MNKSDADKLTKNIQDMNVIFDEDADLWVRKATVINAINKLTTEEQPPAGEYVRVKDIRAAVDALTKKVDRSGKSFERGILEGIYRLSSHMASLPRHTIPAPDGDVCPECGGSGSIEIEVMRERIGIDHAPDCDGSCKNCPVPVQEQYIDADIEPCTVCHGTGKKPDPREVMLKEIEQAMAYVAQPDGNLLKYHLQLTLVIAELRDKIHAERGENHE